MKKLLVLFAKGFPYNTSEPFLENEYPLYKDHYDKVLIITGCSQSEKPTRTVMDPTLEILCDHTLSKDLPSILQALPYTLTDSIFYREIKSLIRNSAFSFKRLYQLLVISLCGNHRALQAYQWLKQHPEYQVDVIYSYWLQIPAYAAVRLNRMLGNRCYTISRVHGYDLYLERHKTGHIPFHSQLYTLLDEIASISENGKQYLEARYGDLGKVSVHRLGAIDQGKHNPPSPRTPFRIVSCSRVIPLKRLNRIVDALSQFSEPIHWTHLGGGDSLEELKQYAEKMLPSNVEAVFSGTIPNTQVYQTYQKEPYHVFVNVSESEGVPVSIMEAMSFDIPVIATAVGGTPELIEEDVNGYLLPTDFKDEELVEFIRKLSDMSDAQYVSFRRNARRIFEEKYNAIPNYRKFVTMLAGRSKQK